MKYYAITCLDDAEISCGVPYITTSLEKAKEELKRLVDTEINTIKHDYADDIFLLDVKNFDNLGYRINFNDYIVLDYEIHEFEEV
jgi:hypothetical protein